MNRYKIRPGDVIITTSPCLILKQTKRYYYYYMNGHQCRIKKEKLWNLVDTNEKIVVLYSKDKKRGHQRSMRTLDLHGVRHESVSAALEDFFNFVELPCKVITGNSKRMKDLLFATVKKYSYECHLQDDYNLGAFVVFEKKETP